MTKHGVDWSKYLKPGESMSDVSANALKRRRYLQLGGTGSSKTEKKALLQREAKQAEYAKQGKLLDDALFAELKQLEEHAKANYEGVPKSCGFGSLGVQWGSKFIPTSDLEYIFHLIQSGGELLRACNWHKLSSDDLDEKRSSILDQDQELPYESQRYYPFYAACMLADIIDVGHRVRLTKELSGFLVRLMQAYESWWAADSTQEDVEYRKQIVRELDQRLAGIDTYVERPPIAVKEEVPILPLQNEPSKKMHQDIQDVPIPDPAPTLTQLAIANYVKSGGNWLEAAATASSGDIAEEIEMSAEAIRKSLIATLTGHINASPGTQQFKSQCIQKLETLTREQLEELLAKSAQEHAQALSQNQDQLLQIRAQRAAEAALFDLQVNKPQRDAAAKAQQDQDRATFEQAAKALRSFGQTDANLFMIRDSLGAGFSVEQVKEFVETNGTLLSPPSTHEIHSWNYQDSQDRKAAEAQRIVMLKNMPDAQLRSEVRQSGQQAQAAAQAAEVQRQIQVREEKEQGFPPLPQVDSNGRTIDSGYVIRLSNAPINSADYKLFRHLCRRFGFAAVTKRLNGIS